MLSAMKRATLSAKRDDHDVALILASEASRFFYFKFLELDIYSIEDNFYILIRDDIRFMQNLTLPVFHQISSMF